MTNPSTPTFKNDYEKKRRKATKDCSPNPIRIDAPGHVTSAEINAHFQLKQVTTQTVKHTYHN